MAAKAKSRVQANAVDASTLTVNEKILRECHSLYTDTEKGLIQIAASVGLKILAPRKKIIVMLMGNHSAGKSSFINWYIEEHVQKTGVAIETQGFTLVTSGRKRESLTGNATLHLYPHLEPLRSFDGVVDFLSTEISTSKQKKFSLVTFIDTPGLVDGDMKYPFDVNEAINWIGDMADLVFVFFDPIGQALCKRTLDLVEKLSERRPDRVRFYLSKADEAGHEADRQRVMMQIVQELCKRPTLNRTAFDMPTIYIPNPSGKPSRCMNQIEEVCVDVEKTINQMIQNTLNSLERDCDTIIRAIDLRLDLDKSTSRLNIKSRIQGLCLYSLALIFPLIMLVALTISTVSRDILESTVGAGGVETLLIYLAPVLGLWKVIPADYHVYIWPGVLFLTAILLVLAKLSSRKVTLLTRKQRRDLVDNKEYISNSLKSKKQSLYQEYLQQAVSEHGL